MPKQHRPAYLKTTNSYVHPSLSRSKPGPSSAFASASGSASPQQPKSVNERLSELRRDQAPRLNPERRNEITDAVTQRTVPPAVRRLLSLPEGIAPRPRPGTVVRHTARRIAGPPPPRSWLETSIHAPAGPEGKGKSVSDDESPWNAYGFSSLAVLEDSPLTFPQDHSLVHLSLKALATNWDYLVEYEQNYLATLPIWLKGILLSYLGAFGPTDCLKMSGIKVLFLDKNEVPGGTGSLELKQLDLSNLLNQKLTIPDLIRYFNSKPQLDISEALKGLSISPDHKESTAPVTESWEDEMDEPTIGRTLSTTRFPNLSRLSLSNPGDRASWNQLLKLSRHLPILTHLSLGYWPPPTLTPNALNAEVVSRHAGPVNLGGSDIYTGYDGNWHEAATILRSLSKNLYCLKWLDLEGCKWYTALVWGMHTPSPGRTRAGSLSSSQESDVSLASSVRSDQPTVFGRRGTEEWQENRAMPGPDWNDSWRNIEYINLSQGWVPRDISAIRRLPAGLLGCELLGYLRERQDAGEVMDPGMSISERQLRYWMELEKEARRVGSMIRAARLLGHGIYCNVDHGWAAPSGTVRTDGGN